MTYSPVADQRDTYERAAARGADAAASGARPWIGVRFDCAGAYVRVTRNRSGTAYQARCPRCGRCVRFVVGAAGTSERFFRVRC